MNNVTVELLKNLLRSENVVFEIGFSLDKMRIDEVTNLSNGHSSSLVFIDSKRADKQELAENTPSHVILCDHEIENRGSLRNKILIRVQDPRKAIVMISNSLFIDSDLETKISPQAYIHPTAKIHESVSVGRNTVIGPRCELKKGTWIGENVVLVKDVLVGENVKVKGNTVLGGYGFGYELIHNNDYKNFPHFGRLVIEDNVEIGSNTCIDRGSLSDTIIGKGTKIDNLVHIGHNVVIGKNVLIAAQTSIGGSSIIGDYSRIWLNSCVADGIQIGKSASIGMGSVVIKNVLAEENVFGNPARKY